MDYALTPRNIKAGFRVTGITPYNPNIFSESDFVDEKKEKQTSKMIELQRES